MSNSNILNIKLIKKSLKTIDVARSIIYLEQTTSTNDIAKKLCSEGHHHGTVIIAEEQTAGRGRKKNRWLSIKGKGLYFSLILEPPESSNVQLLTLGAGIAVANAIEKVCSVVSRLKWPNDVYIQNKKVAGILAEAISKRNESFKVILGVGINVNHDKRDFDDEIARIATSLKISSGKSVPREQVFAEFGSELAKIYSELAKGKTSIVIKYWLDKALYVDEEVVVETENTSVVGKFIGLNDAGAMLLKDHNQNLHEIWAADVVRCRNI
ncbi:MAG TPA: biotin--[acetyl-CoA-carboxylase] ligase [Deltaproteobacteria bacterium]|nr:biotin--[acetyl-CoA-carboxylase] ligase [Deltaproteobacteria bacterium]